MVDHRRPGPPGFLGVLWFAALVLGPLCGLAVVVLAVVLAAHGAWLAAGVAFAGGVALAALLHVAGLVAMFLARDGRRRRPLAVTVAALCGCAGLAAAATGVGWAVVTAAGGAEWTAVRAALGGVGGGVVLVAAGSGAAHQK